MSSSNPKSELIDMLKLFGLQVICLVVLVAVKVAG